jgi:hypothetical protein
VRALRSSTELLLARNAIVIAIHFGTRAVLLKISGLFARSHLGTVLAAIAREMFVLGSNQLSDGGSVGNRLRCLHIPCNWMRAIVQLPANGEKDDEDDHFFHVVSDPALQNYCPRESL